MKGGKWNYHIPPTAKAVGFLWLNSVKFLGKNSVIVRWLVFFCAYKLQYARNGSLHGHSLHRIHNCGMRDLFLAMPMPNGFVYVSTKCECSNKRAERELFIAVRR